MAWCPVCKCEYKKGITKCAECKVDLVDSLEKKEYEPIFEQEDKDAYDSLGFKEVTENKNVHFIDREANIAGVKMVLATKAKKDTSVYKDSKELATENKSSAYILLPVGILGIIAIILIWLDVIPLYSSITSKIITSTVMGILFIVFIVMGILSLKNAKKLDEKAAKEGDLSKEILNYFSENLSANIIDEKINDDQWNELPEEERYFKRIEYIKECIIKQFMNLEENYVDFMCDEIYTKFYEE